MKSIYIFYEAKIRLSILLLALITLGCKKIIQLDAPITSTNASNVYASDATAAAVLTGMYIKMSSGNIVTGGFSSMSFLPGLSADELTLNNGVTNSTYVNYYRNGLTNLNGEFWNTLYPAIFTANSAIEGLTNSTTLTPAVKQQLLGEAKFIRAFCYFYLINLYNDVPLAISSDWQVNSSLYRTPKAQVYQEVVADLKDAQNLLSSNYLKADLLVTTSERVRPTKWAATALLARVYLYIGDYVDAEAQATVVINNSSLYSLTTLNNTFLKNSIEAIWQLQTVTTNPSNTWEGLLFVLPSAGPNSNDYPVYLSNNITNSFESGDQRKTSWVGSVTPNPPGTATYYYVNKYKIGAGSGSVSEYSTVLRLAEQYLIRAEARAQQNNVSGAQSDLNAIRTRAGLSNTSANDKPSLLTAVMQERKVELFTEWGNRWLDLKRTNTVDAVMTPIAITKGGTWQTTDQLYPIPLTELQKAPQLVQNPGY